MAATLASCIPAPSSPGPQTLQGKSQVPGHQGQSQGHCSWYKGRPRPPATISTACIKAYCACQALL